jgi:biotin operon repressor
MSIHVISAVLKCRDPELSSSRRMVMVVLANYAGDTGKAWPSQQLIADETGCGVRSIKDHLAWLEKAGFITRHTQNLGQGNGSRTSYQIHLDRLERTAPNAGEEIAGANIARAKKREPRCNIPHLTNRQEPSIDTIAIAIVAPQPPDPPESKSTGRVRGAARATQLPPNWTPNITNLAYASQHGLSREEINHEADQFRNHAAANGKRFKDWDAGFRTWLGNTVKWRGERAAGQAARAKPGGQSRGGGMVAAGLRAISEARGYGEQVPERGRDMGAGYDLDGDALRIAGS